MVDRVAMQVGDPSGARESLKLLDRADTDDLFKILTGPDRNGVPQ